MYHSSLQASKEIGDLELDFKEYGENYRYLQITIYVSLYFTHEDKNQNRTP